MYIQTSAHNCFFTQWLMVVYIGYLIGGTLQVFSFMNTVLVENTTE